MEFRTDDGHVPAIEVGGEIWAPQDLLEAAHCGGMELVTELLTLFQSDTVARLAAARRAMACSDFSEIRNEAHAIKGSAAQVGARSVAQLSRQMEQLAAEERVADLRRLVDEIENHFIQACGRMSEVSWNDIFFC
jgi:two-component system, sensor histidine kinase and response regulator